MKDLTSGNESKLILQFAMPMLLGNVFQQLYSIIDSIVVGRFIGKEALAAVGASFPIIFTLISLVIGFTMGATIITAQYFGSKQMAKVKLTIDTLYVFLFFASIVLTLLGIALTGPILRMIQIPDSVFPQAKLYLILYLSGLIFMFGFNGTSAVLRGLGDSKTPLYFLVISVIVNIILVLVFVAVFHWGIAGSAIATVIAQAGAFFTAAIYLNRTHPVIKFSIKDITFDRGIFRDSIRIGLPSGLQQTFVSLGLLAITWIVNLFGLNVIAAYSIAMRIDSLATLPAMNFSAALSTFVGQNIGARKTERVRAGLIATIKMTSIISLSITLIAILFSKTLMAFFTHDEAVIAIGARYLVIVSSFYVIFSTIFAINGVMRGAGDTLIPMFITLFALWFARIPVAYFLSRSIGETGIWWSTPIGWGIGMTMGILYYLSGQWKKKSVIRYDETIDSV
jgi:putative MATE family efflux protein